MKKWFRRTRITVLIGLLAAGAALAWLAGNPRLYAGQIGRLVTRNLLQDFGANLSFVDLRGNPLERMTFYEPTLIRSGTGREFLYVSADSVSVTYDLRTLLRREPVLREVVVSGAQVALREGASPPEEEFDDTPHAWTTIEGLPSIEVGLVRLVGVSLGVSSTAGQRIQEVRDVHAEFSIDSDGKALDAVVHALRGQWPSQRVNVHSASGRARFEPPMLLCRGFQVELDSTEAAVDLELGFEPDGDAIVDVRGEAYEFVLSEVLRLILKDDADVPALRVRGEGSVQLRDKRLRIEGSGEGWLGSAPILAREFVGVVDDQSLRFEHVDGSYRSADGTATGVLWTQVEPVVLDLTGRVRGVDLSDPWAEEDLGWPASDLAGGAHVVLEFGESTTAIDLQSESLRGRVAEIPVENARVDLRYDEIDGLDLREAVVWSRGARLEARGTIGLDDDVDLFVQAEADSIDAWAREVELPVTGRGLVGAGRLLGPLDALALDAAGTIENLRWDRLEATLGQFRVRIPRIDVPDRLDAGLVTPNLHVGSTDLGELDVELVRDGLRNEIPSLVLSSADSSVSASGRVIEDEADGSFRVEIDSLVADLSGERWRLEEAAALRLRETGFATAGLTLVSATGRFGIVGEADELSGLGLRLDVLDGDLSILDRIGAVDDIDGDVRGVLQLAGSVDVPELDASFDVKAFRIGPQRVDAITLNGTVHGADVDLHDLRIESDRGVAELRGSLVLGFANWLRRLRDDPDAVRELWSAGSIDVEVRAEELDFERCLDPGAPGGAFGISETVMRARGPVTSPTLEGSVVVRGLPADPFVLPYLEARVRADSTGLSLEEGRVDLGGPDARVRAQIPVFVSLAGASRFDDDAGLEFELDTGADLPLSTLGVLWPQVRSIEGRGRLFLTARGKPDGPVLEGELHVRDGAFALEGWAEELREVEIDGTFAGRQLRIDRLDAREGLRGRIRGTGHVDFVGLLPDDIALDLRAERVLVASVPFLRAIGSGNDLKLRIERPAPDSPRAPKISGMVVVDKAIYTGEFAPEGAATDPALLPTRAPDWLAELVIRAQDQVRISNQSAELRVAGDVTLTRDLDGLRLRGEVQLPQGRVPLFNNDFTITEGSLDFSRRPLEPEVDIFAVTEVPDYDEEGNRQLERITVHLTGTFVEPQIQFESESGLDETSILRLLAGFDRRSTDVGAVGLGDVGLRAGLNFFERALANRIRGVDTIDIQTEEAGLAEMQGTRIAVGKYLSPNLYLRYSQGLSVTERDFFLEYQLTRRTLFKSELKRRLRESGAENEFNLDLKFRVKY